MCRHTDVSLVAPACRSAFAALRQAGFTDSQKSRNGLHPQKNIMKTIMEGYWSSVFLYIRLCSHKS